MVGHLRIVSPWTQLGIFFGLLGAAFILSAIIMFAALPAAGISVQAMDRIDWNNPSTINFFKWLQALSSVVIFFVPAVLYAIFTFRGQYFYFLGFKRPERLNMYVLAVMCIILSIPLVIWLSGVNQEIPLPRWMNKLEVDASKQMEAFLRVNQPYDIFINVFIIALLPAVCEELCFRGALQRIIINITKNPWSGILITAFLFSALHMQFEGFLPRMFLGIILGFLYWYSGSLWTSIAAHFVNNAVQVLAVTYMPKYINVNPQLPMYFVLVSAVAIWAILYYYRKESTVTYARVYEPDALSDNSQFIA